MLVSSLEITHAGAVLAALLGVALGLVLQLLDALLARVARLAVGLDRLLADRGELRLPVPFSLALLLEGVLLVTLELVGVWVC